MDPVPSTEHSGDVAGGGHPRALAVVLAVSVALAFADASVVVLGLPDVYGEFDTTIVAVSWVVTIYAVAVAVVAATLVPFHRRLPAPPLLAAGLTAFALSSLVAGTVSSITPLLVARAVQGVGAALLLAGALPVLAALTGSASSGRTMWATAGLIGAVAGPALGGVLTELFDWRAIFFTQAPIGAAGLLVFLTAAARQCPREPDALRPPGAGAANVGFAFVFAAAVGALFLAVLLLVEVWRFSPLEGAVVVSALPVATLAMLPLGPRLSGVVPAVGGVVLLAGGLVGLAWLPDTSTGYVVAALAACGAGLGLLTDLLGPVALDTETGLLRAGTVNNAARHAGLVLGLALIAPVLADGLEDGARDAAYAGTAALLDAQLVVSEKVPLAWELRETIDATPKGEVPDLEPVFEARGSAEDEALRAAQDDLVGAIEAVLTRAFRPSFLLAATFGALAVIPALVVARRIRRPSDSAAAVTVAVLGAATLVLLSVEWRAGAADFGVHEAEDACSADSDPFPGDGLDATFQRIALGAINGAACELGTTREKLVLSLDPDSELGDVTFDQETAERALRAGALRAIEDADERDTLPGLVATALEFVVERAPIDWLLDRVPLPGS